MGRLAYYLRREGAIRYWGYVLLTCAFALVALVVYVATYLTPLSWDEGVWTVGASAFVLFFAVAAVFGLVGDLRAERAQRRNDQL